jgi:hypothetical protein
MSRYRRRRRSVFLHARARRPRQRLVGPSHRTPAAHFSGKPSLADPPVAAILRVEIFRDAAFRQANDFGERRVRAAGSARRRGNKSRHGRAVVPIERAEIDGAGGAAGRAACPQEPISGLDRRAACRRKQRRHPLCLALVPHGDQVVGILKGFAFRSRGAQPLPSWQLAGARPPFCGD